MTTPYRKAKRNWKLIMVAVVILAASVIANVALRERGADLNQIIYDQCVANETQDAVLTQVYLDDIVFVLATLPPSPQRDQWVQSRRDGIAAIEPADEDTCQPPEGVLP